jgi:uncharacterized protein
MRLVLDTNVWLDWLLFDDPTVRPLQERAETLELLATEAMLDEAQAVLARPWFGIDPARQQALVARLRSLVTICEPAPDCRLACTDPNDQMFIDLAIARKVDWLVSRDKALLRLRRQAMRRFGVRIGTPSQWQPDDAQPGSATAAAGDAPSDL